MTDTHEAVRLADALEDMTCIWSPSDNRDLVNKAAALLRRIPELEAELEAAKLGEAMHDRQATEYAQRVANWIGKFDEVKAERDRLSADLAGFKTKSIGYGCHCDLDPNMQPDGCVLDEGRSEDCVNARRIKNKNDCEYWRPINVTKPATQGREE